MRPIVARTGQTRLERDGGAPRAGRGSPSRWFDPRRGVAPTTPRWRSRVCWRFGERRALRADLGAWRERARRRRMTGAVIDPLRTIGSRDGRCGAHPHRWGGRERARSGRARRGARLPELLALSGQDGAREPRIPSARAGPARERGSDRRARRSRSEHAAHRGPPRSSRRASVGWRDAARRDRPRDRPPAAPVPLRRAAHESRREAAGESPRGARRDAARARNAHSLVTHDQTGARWGSSRGPLPGRIPSAARRRSS
jgi:hypothetical protein